MLDILRASRGGEARGLVDGGLGDRHDLRAVDELVAVVAEDGELGHRGLEAVHHEFLLVHEALPGACRARVARECEVGLETHLAGVVAAVLWQGGSDLAGVVAPSGEADTLQKHLEIDLSVEGERSLQHNLAFAIAVEGAITYRVKGRSVDFRVNLVGTSDRVRGEQRNDLEGTEVTGVGKALQDGANRVRRQGNETFNGRSSRVGASSEELEPRCTLCTVSGP